MVRFFFYNKLTNIELIKKISNNFEIYDGYIVKENNDMVNNILEVNNKSLSNNKLLYGKIVDFNMKIDDIINKINDIEECRLDKLKYTVETILINGIYGGIYKAYIIY